MTQIILQKRTDYIFQTDPPEDLDLLRRHNLYFETRPADTQALINEVHRLRYQVYCLERKFEKTEDHAGGTESDEFDRHSMHGLLIYRLTGEALGTVRIILPDNGRTPDNLPIISLLRDSKMDLADFIPIEKTVEISRFAISKQLRRRLTDHHKASGIAAPISRSERERSGNLPCLSLMQFIVRQSHALGATHWAGVMEVKLLRMLASMGIHFEPIGPVVLHHGLRQPCHGNIAEVLKNLQRQHHDIWNVVTDAGKLAQNA